MKKSELINQIDSILKEQKKQKLNTILESVVLNEEETFNDYPESAVNNAKKALKWKEKYGNEVKGGTRVGWERANQLANKEKLSKSTIKRMHSFFSRHAGNEKVDTKHKNEPWRDRGYIAWLIWGGSSAKNWAEGKVKSFKNDK